MKRLQPAVLICGLAALAACGGGGGGGSGTSARPLPSEALLSGDYRYAGYFENGTRTASESGLARFDGAGLWESSATRNNSSPNLRTWSYRVEPDRTIRASDDRGTELIGGAGEDGALALAATTSPRSVPQIFALLRKEGGFSTAGMRGEFFFVMFMEFPGGYSTTTGTLIFDGTGSHSATEITFTQWLDGRRSANRMTREGSYSVSSEGDLVWSSGQWEFHGAVAAGGDICIASSMDSSMPALLIAARKRDVPAIGGVYHAVSFQYAAPFIGDHSGRFSGTGRLNLSDGHAEHPGLFNNGFTIVRTTLEGSYRTGEDGSIALTLGEVPLQGGAGAGGRIVIAASAEGAQRPVILVAIRM